MGQPGNRPPLSPPPYASNVARHQRIWLAVLTLYILAPLLGEVLSGSTPPLMFINPIVLLYQTALYGSGAIIIRELVRRRGLGWMSIFLLSAAYGILEEGLVVTSWFNPYWADLGVLATYGRLFDTSWLWAVELTAYHAVVSITIPIVLVELLFPRIADRPWLGKQGVRNFIIWLTFISLIGLASFGFLMSRAKGYTHPPLMYLGALLIAAFLVWLGLHLHPQAHKSIYAAAPSYWSLRIRAFIVMVAFFFTAWAMPHFIPWPLVPILVLVGLVALGVWQIARWGRRAAWDATHRLALVSGALGFFIMLSPIIEFIVRPVAKTVTGQTLFAVSCLVALIVLTLVVKRR